MEEYPLLQEINFRDSLTVFSLFGEENNAIFFDSAQYHEQYSRYSFIAVDPFLKITSKNKLTYIDSKPITGNIFEILSDYLKQFTLASHHDLPPFQGGIAGLFSYDLYQYIENISTQQKDEMQFPDLAVGFYDVVLAFDNKLKRAWIFSSGYPIKNAAKRLIRAKERLNYFLDKLNALFLPEKNISQFISEENIHTTFDQSSYLEAVKRVKEYILAGDIFEANISQCFSAKLPPQFSAFDLYTRLRACNPAPFSAYFKWDDMIIVSASPERLAKLSQQSIETRPIKGTCPRSQDSIQDKLLSDQLLKSEKDRAENIMIVDLLRNDLSKVCENHSIKVPQLCGLESYATVHHLVSVVTGKLREEFTAIDLLKAILPGGSITGAPKIRAMEIIAEIEPHQRGVYCGNIAYIGFNGDMDSSILIRTYAIKNNHIVFQAGGAITADSDPEAEYAEVLAKAKALYQTLSSDNN